MTREDPDKKISIKTSTDEQLINEVKNEFLSHHPEFRGMRLSRDFLIKKTIEFYIKKLF